MEYNHLRGFLTRTVRTLGLATLALLLIACSNGGGDEGITVLTTKITTADGGVFSDDATNPALTLTIPAGSLSADGRLTVIHRTNPPGTGPHQTVASDAFQITLVSTAGQPLSLTTPMTIQLTATTAPVHPQLGEIARLSGSTWERLSTSFFTPSTGRVFSQTLMTTGTFRVVHRTLQRTIGANVAEGLDVFSHETFGNESFFGDVMGLHTVLNGVPPSGVVPLGVQVDLTQVPAAIVAVMVGADLAAKDAALSDPAITRQLIKAGAVIGVKGFYATPAPEDTTLTRVGLTCALCHITVAPTEFQLTAGPALLPIGEPQIDGIPNSQMNAGAILALTPFAIAAGPATVDLLNSWGPGRFDVRALPDNPLDDGVNNPTANPPLWNFIDLQEQDYLLGWDGLFKDNGVTNNALASQAEAVYDLVMHSNGAFGTASGNFPPELSVIPPAQLLADLATAEAATPGNDMDTQKILDVQTWMRSLASPAPGPFDEALALEGFTLFHQQTHCARCHSTADLTGPGLFTTITTIPPAGDLAGGIKVPSLRGIGHTAPYFHDQSANGLIDVVARFVANGHVPPLTGQEQAAIVAYLNSL